MLVSVMVLRTGHISADDGLVDSLLVSPRPERQNISSTEKLCSQASLKTKHNFTTRTSSYPSIYDMVMCNDELDMLEIRLHELKDVVDFFVIVESRVTFTNQPKPFHFENSKSRFDFVRNKIIHVVLDTLEGKTTWDREAFQRDAMFSHGLKGRTVFKGDVLLTSDVDEIPRAWVIKSLKFCEGFSGTLKFELRFFYYSFWYRGSDNWPIKMAMVLDSNETIPSSNFLRSSGAESTLFFEDAGWHCSYCFEDVAHFVSKLRSFSHSEYDKPKYYSHEIIVDSIRRGVSLIGHLPEDYFALVRQDVDAPQLVNEKPERFHYLLNRTGPSAGLSDVVHEA